MYEGFIDQLKMYIKAIRIFSKDYLPVSLLPPLKTSKLLDEVKKALQSTNRDYGFGFASFIFNL